MVSKLIIHEQPLLVLPALAVKVGLNEAIILQQIHYWLERSQHDYDGHKWIYNTIPDWQNQFPFWSESTIKRTLKSLESKNVLLKGNYNRLRMDRTVWYSINYNELKKIEENVDSTHKVKMTLSSGQNEPMEKVKMTSTSGQNEPMTLGQNEPTNTREYTETTTKITTEKKETYLDCIKLTHSEYQKLFNEYGEEKLNTMLQKLASYLLATGKRYKSHYAVLGPHNWVHQWYEEEQRKKKAPSYNGKRKEILPDWAQQGVQKQPEKKEQTEAERLELESLLKQFKR